MSLLKVSGKPEALMSLAKRIKNGEHINLGNNTGAARSYVLSMAAKQKGVGKKQGKMLTKYKSTTHAGEESKRSLRHLNMKAGEKLSRIHDIVAQNTKAGKLVR
jgi:hypothetical protein